MIANGIMLKEFVYHGLENVGFAAEVFLTRPCTGVAGLKERRQRMEGENKKRQTKCTLNHARCIFRWPYLFIGGNGVSCAGAASATCATGAAGAASAGSTLGATAACRTEGGAQSD